MTKLDLRRDCFESMHPASKLFNFDKESELYVGDDVEKINSHLKMSISSQARQCY